jgi:GntR family transcriptional regulator
MPGLRTACEGEAMEELLVPGRRERAGRAGPGLRLSAQIARSLTVVAKLAINANTVLRACRDLEGEGLARARPGQGTFIIGSLPATDRAVQARLPGALTDWLGSARAAALGPDEVEAIYRTAFRNFFTEGAA